MSNKRAGGKIIMWAVAVAGAVCVATLIVIASYSRLEPIPEESIAPVMPIVTEDGFR